MGEKIVKSVFGGYAKITQGVSGKEQAIKYARDVAKKYNTQVNIVQNKDDTYSVIANGKNLATFRSQRGTWERV